MDISGYELLVSPSLSLRLLLSLLLIVTITNTEESCSKHHSRIARKFISQEIEPDFRNLGHSLPKSCPFHADFDIYAVVEGHKEEDAPSRWLCGLCGKAFYEERFLDAHFENRHSQFIRRGAGVVCLADFCDILRCDVISGKKKPQYWDLALCRERDLYRLQHKCQATLEKCIPTDIPSSTKSKLKGVMNETFCDYLTCDMYWELPESEISPISLAVYTILSVVLVFGLIVYYYVAYTHFYTRESMWDSQPHYEESPSTFFGPYAPPGQEMRFRTFSVPS